MPIHEHTNRSKYAQRKSSHRSDSDAKYAPRALENLAFLVAKKLAERQKTFVSLRNLRTLFQRALHAKRVRTPKKPGTRRRLLKKAPKSDDEDGETGPSDTTRSSSRSSRRPPSDSGGGDDDAPAGGGTGRGGRGRTRSRRSSTSTSGARSQSRRRSSSGKGRGRGGGREPNKDSEVAASDNPVRRPGETYLGEETDLAINYCKGLYSSDSSSSGHSGSGEDLEEVVTAGNAGAKTSNLELEWNNGSWPNHEGSEKSDDMNEQQDDENGIAIDCDCAYKAPAVDCAYKAPAVDTSLVSKTPEKATLHTYGCERGPCGDTPVRDCPVWSGEGEAHAGHSCTYA